MVMHSMRTRISLAETNRAVVMALPNFANIADVGDRLKTALSAGRGGDLEKNKRSRTQMRYDNSSIQLSKGILSILR